MCTGEGDSAMQCPPAPLDNKDLYITADVATRTRRVLSRARDEHHPQRHRLWKHDSSPCPVTSVPTHRAARAPSGGGTWEPSARGAPCVRAAQGRSPHSQPSPQLWLRSPAHFSTTAISGIGEARHGGRAGAGQSRWTRDPAGCARDEARTKARASSSGTGRDH